MKFKPKVPIRRVKTQVSFFFTLREYKADCCFREAETPSVSQQHI